MTNRSLIFSEHLDSAPFKDFNIEVAVIQEKLQNKDLWVKRNEIFPIENYSKEEIRFIDGKLKGIYGVFSIIDENTIELQNNSTVPLIIGTLNNHGLNRHMLLEIEYDYFTKEIVVLKRLNNLEVDNKKILKTSSNFKVFRDELVYYILLMPSNYQEVAIQVLEPLWDSFKNTPGSIAGHHVFLGGLLEHTVEDIRIAKAIMELSHYEQDKLLGSIYTLSASSYWEELRKKRRGEKIETALNYMVNDFYLLSDIYLSLEGEILFENVVLSFILHDLGKIIESVYLNDDKSKYNLLGMGTIVNEQQNKVTFFESDFVGGQFGHVVLSMLMFNKVKPIEGVDLVLINRIIATHHGSINFGSIKPAESKFEYLINISDKIGALFCGINKRVDIKYE